MRGAGLGWAVASAGIVPALALGTMTITDKVTEVAINHVTEYVEEVSEQFESAMGQFVNGE